MDAIELIREQVARCNAEGVGILCCPEGILGGLADNVAGPVDFAIGVDTGELAKVLSPLASDSVTTIIGFTELGMHGRLFNSAAVFHRGAVIGVYRKLFPAIRESIYTASATRRRYSPWEISHLELSSATIPTSRSPREQWRHRARRCCSFQPATLFRRREQMLLRRAERPTRRALRKTT